MSAVNVLAEVEAVAALMQIEALCPSFLDLGDGPGDRPYEGPARVAVPNPEYQRNGDAPQWIDGDSIHPDHPDAIRFFGNFAGLSRVFTIDTDDAELIAKMRGAIAENMARFGVGGAA